MLHEICSGMPPFFSWFIPIIIVVAIFEWTLKIVAMWKAARNNEMLWFVLIAVINTAGILPLIYILMRRDEEKKQQLH